MRKQTKKGFTIVELVIVIALIAILAAVLIPTFSNVINNAHESNDTVMVKNLNTILNAEENSGNPAANMTEAIYQAKEGGYNVDKLTPTSSGDIVWDQVSNRFVLINAKGKVVFSDESKTEIKDDDLKTENAYRFWKITSDIENDRSKDAGYSWYLADGYKGKTPINATTGIDVGTNEGVTVNYVNDATDATAKNVLLRTNGTNGTNGGTLTVNAEKDTVSHYGTADKVVITAVAGNSYHEFGEVVGNIEIAKGHIELAASANVNVVIVKSEVEGAVNVEVVSGATVKAIAPATEAAKKDVQDATGVADKVKQTKVAENADKFTGGLGTKENPYLVSTAEQLMFMNGGTIDGEKGSLTYIKVVNDIDLRGVAHQELTANGLTFKCYLGDSETNGTVYYFHIDGGNHDIYLDDNVSFLGDIRNSTLTNVKLHMGGEASVAAVAFPAAATIENLSIYSDTKLSYDRNSSMFVGTMTTNTSATLVVRNCKNYARIEGTAMTSGYNGLFIGGLNVNAYRSGKFKLTVDGFENYGNIKSGKMAAIGNIYGSSGQITVDLKNIKNDGDICSLYAPLNQYVAAKNEKTTFTSIKVNGITKTADDKFLENYRIASANETMRLIENEDKTFTITKSTEPNVSYYVVSLSIYTNYKKSNVSGTDIYTINEKIMASAFVADTFTTSIKNLGFMMIQDGASIEEFESTIGTEISHSTRSNNAKVRVMNIDGVQYYVVDIPYESVSGVKNASSSMIAVTAYAEDGTPISSVCLSK